MYDYLIVTLIRLSISFWLLIFDFDWLADLIILKTNLIIVLII